MKRGTQPTEPDRDQRGFWFSSAVVVFYSALGIWAYWPLFQGGHRIPSQVYGDPIQMVWYFGWTAHAVSTGHNPFFASVANVPFGMNMGQQAFMPLLGALLTPITLLVGPVTSVNVCFVAALPLSAFSAYWVLRRWAVWAPAAALGGLAYGFSPYVVNQGSQHLNLVFVPLPPLIVAALADLLGGSRHPLQSGAVLGTLIAAQFLISSEVLTLTAVMSVVGLALVAIHWVRKRPRGLRPILGPVLSGAGCAVVVAGAFLAYPVWYQFAGRQHYSGAPWPDTPSSLGGIHASLLGLVSPTPVQLLHPALSNTGAQLYGSSLAEDGAYIGFAVLAVTAGLIWFGRRSGRLQLAAGVGLISALFSLGGSYQTSNGSRSLSLPFHFLAKLPALGYIIPVRFSFITEACTAAVLAFGLDSIRRHPADARLHPDWAKVGLAVSALAVATAWLPNWPFQAQSGSTLPSAITRAFPAGDPIVLTYPYPLTGQVMPMMWQAEDQFRFRLIGVYARVPQIHGPPASQTPLLDPPAVQEYLGGEEGEGYGGYPNLGSRVDVAGQLKVFVARYHVGAVIIGLSTPNSAAVAETITSALGPARTTSGGYELWITGS